MQSCCQRQTNPNGLEAALEAADALVSQPVAHWTLAELRLTRARALMALGGDDMQQAVEEELTIVHQWLDDLGSEGQKPHVHEARAELALALGDEAGYRRELEAVAAEFDALGAAPHADRVRARRTA